MKNEYIEMFQEQKANLKEKSQMELLEEYEQDQMRVKKQLLEKYTVNEERRKKNEMKQDQMLKEYESIMEQRGTGLIGTQIDKQSRSVQNLDKIMTEKYKVKLNRNMENRNRLE